MKQKKVRVIRILCFRLAANLFSSFTLYSGERFTIERTNQEGKKIAIAPLSHQQIYIFLTTSCATLSFSFLAREVLSSTPIDSRFYPTSPRKVTEYDI
ncbi:hypothetical protein POREN0001_0094 [Porphyromonas endodontalis ATCC 35406]|uniref:Uncharacterized protein n=1 Tax=Porphyromonas endodontalis (strain ATCC 35406 / DSM 24491 / JCM 8526 / CCUG 16442 / BCRC 14492 / NCTC 13058 / HG 370) TaxID=553175 RepID=C3JCE9_POREA|nr:hypothetical protein POREN0001_0094 [Porphyromonas endodontalis ATCC 35406]